MTGIKQPPAAEGKKIHVLDAGVAGSQYECS